MMGFSLFRLLFVAAIHFIWLLLLLEYRGTGSISDLYLAFRVYFLLVTLPRCVVSQSARHNIPATTLCVLAEFYVNFPLVFFTFWWNNSTRRRITRHGDLYRGFVLWLHCTDSACALFFLPQQHLYFTTFQRNPYAPSRFNLVYFQEYLSLSCTLTLSLPKPVAQLTSLAAPNRWRCTPRFRLWLCSVRHHHHQHQI